MEQHTHRHQYKKMKLIRHPPLKTPFPLQQIFFQHRQHLALGWILNHVSNGIIVTAFGAHDVIVPTFACIAEVKIIDAMYALKTWMRKYV
jgi:hypothetical protein